MSNEARRRFVVVSGLPASGKTTIARRLEPLLRLPVIDKDEVLEGLFDRELGTAIGSRRRDELSRQADDCLRELSERSDGAILVSFWRRAELSPTSGTPTDWLVDLGRITELHCRCEPATAARRFVGRRRHSGHGDPTVVTGDLLARFGRLAELGPLGIGDLVVVDTTQRSEVDGVEDVADRLAEV